MQDVHDCQEASKLLLKWSHSKKDANEKNKDYELDTNTTEDAMARKRRLQAELGKALAVLGVKHSTFQSNLNKGKHAQVKAMLKEACRERCDRLMQDQQKQREREWEGIEDDDLDEKEQFNIHLEQADMKTIHEAYHFLVNKYVDGDEDLTSGMFLSIDELRKKNQRRKSSNNLMAMDDKDKRRNSFIAMTGIELEDSDKKSQDADKVAASMLALDMPTSSKDMKRQGSMRRRKSVLMGIDGTDIYKEGIQQIEENMKKASKERKKKSGQKKKHKSSVSDEKAIDKS